MSKNKWRNMMTQRIHECIRSQIDQQRNESAKYIAIDKLFWVSQKDTCDLQEKQQQQ